MPQRQYQGAGIAGLAGTVTMHPVYGFFLVLENLPVQLVDQRIDSGVHILVLGLGVDLSTDHVQGRFCNLTHLLHFQGHLAVADVVEMALQFTELLGNIVFQGGSQINVMARLVMKMKKKMRGHVKKLFTIILIINQGKWKHVKIA